MLTKNPKQARNGERDDRWFGYYAGYSGAFVAEALTFLGLRPGARIADPWNGSGTTTDIADQLGYTGVGYDLNPAAVLVAKSRLLRSDVEPSHRSLAKEVIRCARRYSASDYLSEEPLSSWFHAGATASLRGIERAIQHLFLPAPYRRIASLRTLEDVSPLAACYYVALFRTLRIVLAPFETSNPTWIRKPKNLRTRLRPSSDSIYLLFAKQLEMMFLDIKIRSSARLSAATTADIGDSTNLPLLDGTVDAIIASPPYCTRIDYAVAMRPELSVLGASNEEFARLRSSMIGSTVMSPSKALEPSKGWGDTCLRLLPAIRAHRAHGSRTYYYQTHLQYFAGLHASLCEVSRVLSPVGKAVLVVQDSYYKELHTDLQRIAEEMCLSIGLKLELRRDYSFRNTKAALNTQRLKYRKTADATESVLVFRHAFSNAN